MKNATFICHPDEGVKHYAHAFEIEGERFFNNTRATSNPARVWSLSGGISDCLPGAVACGFTSPPLAFSRSFSTAKGSAGRK